MRYYQLHFQCDGCPNEFEDTSLVVTSAYCPCCDCEVEPYFVEEFHDDEDAAEELDA